MSTNTIISISFFMAAVFLLGVLVGSYLAQKGFIR